MLGCGLAEGFVKAGWLQQTSQPGIYCAGEPTGIGGVELSLLEGQIAGYAAAGATESVEGLVHDRGRYRRLATAMHSAFRLKPELARLPQDDTWLCRCEDVTMGRVGKCAWGKDAKLETRCGMGPCQGRVCGAAAAFLFGWTIPSVRPPIFPARCSSLAAVSTVTESPQPI